MYHIPLYADAGGNGYWFTIKAAVSEVDALRQSVDTTLRLQFLALRKEVTFDSGKKGPLSESLFLSLLCFLFLTSDHSGQPGIFMFTDYTSLKDFPGPSANQMQVDMAPDRIVFFVKGDEIREYGLVSSSCIYFLSL